MKETKAFNLFDFGLKKAGKIQIYDENSLDSEGNIIPFETQAAIVSHYLQNDGGKLSTVLQEKGSKLVRFWLEWVQDNSREIDIDERIVAEPSALDTYLFKDIYNPPFKAIDKPKFTFIDLFAGMGGFRLAMQEQGGKCVFSSEWNKYAQKTYYANFGEYPFGDITLESTKQYIPEGFDVLCAGFPCQPFSIAGVSKKKSLGRETGFKDKTQGTLFFDVADIINRYRPKAFYLENVKNLTSHDKGNTFRIICETLEELDYSIHYKVMDGQTYVPQHRERIMIVGFDRKRFHGEEVFIFPKQHESTRTIKEILEENIDPKYTLSDKLWAYLQDYAEKHRQKGNGFGYGLVDLNGIARTLSARYYKDGSEILIPQGEGKNPRKLSPRECARLMGYPDEYILDKVSDVQAYRQCGNSVIVPLITAVSEQIIKTINDYERDSKLSN